MRLRIGSCDVWCSYCFAAESSSKPDTAKLLQLVLGIAINCEQKESKS